MVVEGGATAAVALSVGLGLMSWSGLGWTAPLLAGMPVAVALAASWTDLRLHPLSTMGPANRVTLVRAVLVGVLAAFVGETAAGELAWGLAVVASVALALDGVDGRVARMTGSESPFGARLDMELDAVTVAVLSVLVWQLDKAGVWVLLSGALRYLYVAAGWVWPWLRAPVFPSFARKVVCVVQVGALLVCLLPPVMAPWSTGIAAAALVALFGSFGRDIVWLFQRRAA